MTNGSKPRVAPGWRHQSLKCLVAFIAGISAVLIPRVLAQLAIDTPSVNFNFLEMRFLIMALVFGLIVALCATILMWWEIADPPRIFAAALSVPAVIGGGIGTVQGVNSLEYELNSSNAKALEIIERRGYFISPDAIDRSKSSTDGNNGGLSELKNGTGFFRSAYADTTESKLTTKSTNEPLLGRVYAGPFFQIGIAKIQSEEQAKKLNELLGLNFEVYPATDGKSYFLINPDVNTLMNSAYDAVLLEQELDAKTPHDSLTNGTGDPSEQPNRLTVPHVIVIPASE